MNQGRWMGRSIGRFYPPTSQPNPAYWQTPNQCKVSFPASEEKKKFKNLLIQSYWVIWLLFSFIVALNTMQRVNSVPINILWFKNSKAIEKHISVF
jgi:hypothetical protein